MTSDRFTVIMITSLVPCFTNPLDEFSVSVIHWLRPEIVHRRVPTVNLLDVLPLQEPCIQSDRSSRTPRRSTNDFNEVKDRKILIPPFRSQWPFDRNRTPASVTSRKRESLPGDTTPDHPSPWLSGIVSLVVPEGGGRGSVWISVLWV